MNDDLDWTTDLGDAFVNQPKDVADAIQRMRAKAEATGALKTTQQQKVVKQKESSRDVIIIESASPDVIYVPVYDPVQVYNPTAGIVAASLLTFGTAVAIGSVWNNNYWNWGSGVVYPPRWPGYPATGRDGTATTTSISATTTSTSGTTSTSATTCARGARTPIVIVRGRAASPAFARRTVQRRGPSIGQRPPAAQEISWAALIAPRGAWAGRGSSRSGGGPAARGSAAGDAAAQAPRPEPRPAARPSQAKPGGAFGGVEAGRAPAQAFSNRGGQSINRAPAMAARPAAAARPMGGGGGRGGMGGGGGGRGGRR